MQGWKTFKLGDVILLKRGYDLPERLREKGNYQIISSSGVTDTHIDFKVQGPGVVTGRYGTIGKVFYTTKNFWPLNTSLYVKDFKGNDSKFIYYLFHTINWQSYSTKSAVPGIDRNEVHQEAVVLPPLQEQKGIASILSALDDKIELNLQMNKTLEEMVMALYKHWFVDFGPFQDGKFVESELGMIPEGWEVKSIYDIANYVNGAAFKPSEFTNEGLYVIKISELNSGITKNTGKSAKHVKPEQIIDSGCVLFSWSATLDIFLWDKGKALLNQHIFNVLPNGTVSLEVLYFSLKNIIKHFKAIAAERATTMGHIKLTHLKETFISIPIEKDIQLQIDKLFKPIYSQMLENLLENQTLTTLRDTLLPKLISGEVRVKDIEHMVAASL